MLTPETVTVLPPSNKNPITASEPELFVNVIVIVVAVNVTLGSEKHPPLSYLYSLLADAFIVLPFTLKLPRSSFLSDVIGTLTLYPIFPMEPVSVLYEAAPTSSVHHGNRENTIINAKSRDKNRFSTLIFIYLTASLDIFLCLERG